MSGLRHSLRLLGRSRTVACLIASACLLGIPSAVAQSDRITGAIDNHKAVVVEGHLHPLACAEFDRGAVPPDFALRGMTLTIRRTAAQQSDLDRLLAAQQDRSSPHYRKWLTPEEFADRFGASSNDLARLREWLEGQGLQIKAVARGRTFIRFDATAEQVRHAFGTEIHHYSVDGAMHYANAGPPMLPAALAPLLLRVGGMDDFAPHPDHVAFARLKNNATVAPDYSYGDSLHALAPADLLAIYGISGQSPLPDGTGQTVVVIGSSDTTATDLQVYCTLSTDLACGTAFIVAPPGEDPGTDTEWATEETMDLELVSAVAPGSALVLDLDPSVWNALYDAVDNSRGQVISMSFGVCESLVDAALVSSVQAAAQQANAQGITLIASSGDSGGAGCDSGAITDGGAHAAAVDLPASLPEVTGVGGTEFIEGTGAFWSGGGTATGYIPEEVWNDTTATRFAASGGGVSTLFTKPAWQSGTGVLNVPADGQRDVPDVALAASAAHDGYAIALNGVLSTSADPPYVLGGTSASTAVFAGIVALLNESLGSASGNINAALYTIAGGSSSGLAFHDVATGNNIVPCASDSNCASPPLLGWNAGIGYDLATGLGSVNESQLLAAWPTGYDTPPANIVLSPSSVGAGSSTQSVSITGTGLTNLSSVTLTVNSLTTVLPSSCTSASCSATVPASLMTTPVIASVQVVSASGLSASAPFTIASAPTITSPLSPASANAGDPPFTLAVSGTNFVGGSTVYWGSTSLFTTYFSATSLTANVTITQLASAGSQAVTVKNPTGVSNGITFTVNGPAIGTNGLTPNSVVAGTGSLTLTVTGTNFASGSTVMWGATALTTNPTTPGSTTSLTAAVTGTQVASAGPQNVTVQDAYGVSGASVFTVNGPTITTLTPNSAFAGSLVSPATLAVAVAGANFVSGVSTVYWGSTALATTYNSASSLTAYVTSTQFASSGSGRVTVQNGGATAASGASLFVVNGPTIATLTPNSAFAGSLISPATLAVAVAGANFVSGSIVYWGSTALATTYNSANSLTVYVTSAQLASTGSGSITVQNTATAVSITSPFTVSGPTITTLTPNSAVAGSLTSPATLPVAVAGTNFISGVSTVYWGSTPLATTYNGPASLTAYVTSTQLASSGPGSITVQNTATATSAASTFTVLGPTIASLSLPSIVAGTTTPTSITVFCTNFVPVTFDGSGNYAAGSMVYSGTTALAATSGNMSSITAAVPASLVSSAGKLSLTVHNPGGATSSAYTLTVVGPTITALSAPSAIAGSPGFSLTVTGTNFINPGSVVMWGSTPLATNYNSATSLTATVASAQLASAGPHNVTVRNSSSASPPPLTFTVDGPIITSLSLNSIAAGSAAQPVTITGTNFIAVTLVNGNYASGSLVYSGTTALAVTNGTATSLTATIPASLVASAGTLSLTVQNPGGAASSVRTLAVNGPTISSLSPNPAVAGGPGFQLTVTGTNFVNGSKVMWAGTQLVTFDVDATSLTATVTNAQLRSAGPQNVTVRNSSSSASTASSFAVNGPTITSLSPASAAAGDAAFTLTVTGLNFVGGSTVYWGTTPLAPIPDTPGTATSLAAAVTSAQLASTGPQNVTVHNSSTASSPPHTFLVTGPAIASLSPTSAVAGSGSFPLTVTGTNFVGGSKVLWNSTPLTITSNNFPTSLTATVTSAQLNSAGSARVTVQNSSTASSSASPFTIVGPTIVSLNPTSIPAGSTTATIAVTGTNFVTVVDDGSGNYVSGSLVYSGTTALPVTWNNGVIVASIPAHLVAGRGTLSLSVHNPGGAKSSASAVTVVGPTITSLTPTSASAGSAPFSFGVTGTNFVGGSTVYWGATPLTPDPASPGTATSLTALVTSAQLASAGSQKITVHNSSTAISSTSAFVVNGPTITSLSPNSMAAGSATLALTVTGIDFVSGSRVMWGATALATNPTTPGSTTSLTATVTSTQLASAGSPKITVQNTSTASSSAIAFTVNSPMIASLSPTSAVAGGAGFALTVIGTNFVAGSKVLWGGKPLATSPTTPGSTTSLTATVASARLASAGSPKVTVQNTSTASSPAIAFTVTRP
jgi:subtilase family serine protease